MIDDVLALGTEIKEWKCCSAQETRRREIEIEMYWEKRGALGSEVKYFGTKF